MHYSNVLVVAQDDNMLHMLCDSIAKDPAMHLAGCCGTADEALRLAKELKPDVIAFESSLFADGLQTISSLHDACGAAIVAISTVMGNAIQLLDAGAADFIHMPVEGNDSDHSQFIADTIERLKIALLCRTATRRGDTQTTVATIKLIVVAAAAGGPVQLATLLKGLPMGCPPILVLQQTPEAFGSDYTAILSGMTGRAVLMAENGMELNAGTVVVADARYLAEVISADGKLGLSLTNGYCTTGMDNIADLLFLSATQALGDCAVGISLSGNGLVGLKRLKECGALVLLHNKNALLHDIGYMPPNCLPEMPLEDIPGEVSKRIRGIS